MVELLESEHVYLCDGHRWPGITRVLADLGYYPKSDWYTNASRQQGQLIHQACELVDRHCPDVQSLDEVLEVLDLGTGVQPYVAGYLLFKRETGFRAHHSEVLVSYPGLCIAGRVDLIGEIRGTGAVVDLKRWKSPPSTVPRAAELQTAAYAMMARVSLGVNAELRFVTALPGTGAHRLYRCFNPSDELLIPSLAAIWWDRVRAGLIEWRM